MLKVDNGLLLFDDESIKRLPELVLTNINIAIWCHKDMGILREN